MSFFVEEGQNALQILKENLTLGNCVVISGGLYVMEVDECFG